jgi:mannose-6-phosphate isomerase-like protein (cupin superfamily)
VSVTAHGSSGRDREESTVLGWVGDIERTTLENGTFRTVMFTGEHAQLTVMRLRPGEDIGREAHASTDQFIRVEQGQARVELGTAEDWVDATYDVDENWAIVIPAGVWHNVINTGIVDLKLYSLYSPPEHRPGTIHRTKDEAEAGERILHG